MSAPSSDGRPSVSSEPSATSSRTLHSRGSGAYIENGEGSQQRRGVDSRHSRSAGNAIDGPPAENSLAMDLVAEQDFGRRRQRVRRSGGFLLDAGFPSAPRKGHDHHQQLGGKGTTVNSKNGPEEVQPEPSEQHGRHERRKHEHATNDQSALEDPSYATPATPQKHTDGELRVGKTRHHTHHTHHTKSSRTHVPTAPQQQPIDPSQLVHMALNLSESRRRNISAGPLLASQARTSSGVQRDGSLSNNAAGSSLRIYLNEQRRMSRAMSPMGKGSPSRHMSNSVQRSGSTSFPGAQSLHPSAATLARRDKARDYIELRMEYLRLLEFLPPLKPDSNAPGNFTFTANNVPGSPQAQLTRVQSYAGKQYDLGRPYNPLQYIRNRRSRARERRTLNCAPEKFTDVDEVHEWVDHVEEFARRPGYRREDAVLLPTRHDDDPKDVAQSTPSNPHKGWAFSSEELFADAYWLEHGDNKTIIENRHGRTIFQPKEAKKPDLLNVRSSKEYPEKRRRSWIDGIPGGTTEPTTGDESDKGSDRGRKLRLLPPFRADSSRPGRHSRRGSRLRANIDGDTSDSDTASAQAKPRIIVDAEHNTGPLALQMEQMLKRHNDKDLGKSPAIISPDTPDKWGRHSVDVPEGKISRDSLEVPQARNGIGHVEPPGSIKMPPRSWTNGTLSGDETEPRSSFEDLDSTTPNTPLYQKRFPHIGTSLSPPPSRGNSLGKTSRRSKLNPFHSAEANEDHKHDLQKDMFEKKRASRQVSEETQENSAVGQAILAAPSAVKSFLGHRKNESSVSLPSPERERRRDIQEPQSAVTRFFKGVKNEGSKVSGFVFRRERPDDDDPGTLSDGLTGRDDSDLSSKDVKTIRPTVSRTTTATTVDTLPHKTNGHYHLDLPEFKPAHEVLADENRTSMLGDHITRQNRERKNSRSPRFDRLAPPKMDLERVTSNSSTTSVSISRSQSQERISKVLARPGGVGTAGLPVTALAPKRSLQERQHSGSRTANDGKRHWSIANEDEHVSRPKDLLSMVSQADIAHVRALFICSGVKAKEINRRAYTARIPPPDFLTRAAATANRQLYPVRRKEEHVLAARFLMRELESSTEAHNVSAQHFRNETIKNLTDSITTLRARIDTDLMPRLFESGDIAVRTTSEISGMGPLQVKQILDDIDQMLRARRRRMKWIRGFGWMLVEWALVAVMWWVWLVVVLVGFVKRLFGFGWGVVRWLLWL